MPGDPFQRAFEAAPEAQLLLDTQGNVLSASEGYLRAAVLTRAAITGKPLRELAPYLDAPAACDELRDSLETLLRSAFPSPNALADCRACVSGTLFTRGSSVPVLDDAGTITQIVHRLESEPLRMTDESARERKLRKMIEYSVDAFVLTDARINFTFLSPSIERLTGYTPAEMLSRSAMSHVHPDDVGRLGAAARQILEKPGSVLTEQLRLRHRDGSFRTIELTGVNYLHDPDLNALVGTLRDISERVALETELRRGRDHLTVALEAAHAITWERDLLAQKAWYSSDFATYFGLPPGTYDGNDASVGIHPEDLAIARKAMEQAHLSGDELRYEFRGMDRGADTRYYASRGRVFRDADGKPVRHIGVIWDITEARRLQQERLQLEQRMQEGQKLESLGVLAGGIAHDFNNLLMAIMGNASLMRLETSHSSASLSHLRQIEEASRRASDLCRQMLAYAGKGRFMLSRTNLNELIEETTHLLQVSISKKAVLRFHLYPNLPAIIADATQMRQVLMNLVINASDAIGERSGVISISTGVVRADRAYLDNTFLSPDLAEGDYVFLEVSDTGRGMSTETQARIFEPFFSTKAPGRGLGLAAVLGIVRGHKGALKLYSEPGKGSSFKFLLPPAVHTTERSAAQEPPLAAHAPGGVVLVVDDEETLRAVASQMVEQLGMRTRTASDGREALAVYREHSHEIAGVLMDLTMPHMDGEEAFRELRRINPNVRVLLMSGYNEQDAIARFVGKGLAGFIQKPFMLEELDKQLRVLLG